MVVGTLFILQLIFWEGRTLLELALDCLGIVGTLGSLVLLQLSKRIDVAFIFVAGVILVVLAALLLVVGNRNGDLFLLLIMPVFAATVLGARRSLFWFAATLLVTFIVAVGPSILPELSSSLHVSDINPEGLLFHGPAREALTGETLLGFLTSLTLSYLGVYAAYAALLQANERIEGLLLNVLPSSIAARLTDETRQKLQEDGTGIADEHSDVTILFADIVGFTDLAARKSTTELLTILDAVFTAFDRLAETHQVEKIKTIGDAYMAVCGLPEPNADHARHIADMALDMLETIKRFREEAEIDIRLRIGVNSGPVIAGIIGRKKFIYDLWGDAVNIASRMESHGAPETIQVGTRTREALKHTHAFEALGDLDIKGKGQLPAWRLLGPIAG